LLYGYPNDCGLPAIPFAQLNGALQYLKTQPEGCAPATMACPALDLGSDVAYCQWTSANPLRGPSATLGWVYQSVQAGNAFQAGPQISVPTIILSNTTDTVVDPSKHNCSKFSGECKVVQFADYGHELLALASDREAPIGQIRTWLKAHMK
jgi:alpha-beta hydrolase superfamily lysophospholipase